VPIVASIDAGRHRRVVQLRPGGLRSLIRRGRRPRTGRSSASSWPAAPASSGPGRRPGRLSNPRTKLPSLERSRLIRGVAGAVEQALHRRGHVGRPCFEAVTGEAAVAGEAVVDGPGEAAAWVGAAPSLLHAATRMIVARTPESRKTVRAEPRLGSVIGPSYGRRGLRLNVPGPRRTPARRGPVADGPAHQVLRRGQRRPSRSLVARSSRAPRRETLDGSAAGGLDPQRGWQKHEDQQNRHPDHHGRPDRPEKETSVSSHGLETRDARLLFQRSRRDFQIAS